MHRAIPPTAPSRFGLFTAREADAAGWTPTARRTAVERQRIVRVCRGVYVDADRWNAGDGPARDRARHIMRTAAALLVVNTSAASHTSSALLAGLPTWTIPDRPCLTVRPKYTGDSRDAHLHRASFTARHIVADSPLRRLSTARTVVDIAREHGVEDAVVVGDCALRRGLIVHSQLAAEIEFCARWPGIRRAVDVVRLLDPRSESPLESVSRIRMAARGVPRPEPQAEVYTRGGLFLGRLDFYWDEFGVAGEVDGRVKYGEDPVGAVLREKRRQGPMEELGMIFLRWGRRDLDDMARLESRLGDVFARGARRPRSDRAFVIRLTDPADIAPRMRAG